ncbi:hypothetical protein QJS04_geneDACA014835 [Acorus gramineus]|uniref:Autophagy-related protein 16 domain-containing protein n=1 Tax=Acorus gramineus TaxID=55184 RepID=A0AAV9BR91_ACOGR|nr:hypothetical protein QJS04_geneDACA014835 [Acorus gramineus]
MKALRRRHLLEEGAHGPAFAALLKPITLQGFEWKEKAENLELELQQCYKAQSRLSEQLVVEVAESRNTKALIQEKETLITDLQSEIEQKRDECCQLKESLDEKTKALDVVLSENHALKAQLEELMINVRNTDAENKLLVDRIMSEKLEAADKINEVNFLCWHLMRSTEIFSYSVLKT